jgi:hypothetical protein
MPNHRFAEWLLARFTGPTRASAIIGDLTESAPHSAFRRAYATVLAHAAWRSVAGFLAVQVAAYALAQLNAVAFYGSAHAHTVLQAAWATSVGGLCALFCVIPVYCAFCFGLRDPLTRTSLAALALAEAAVLFWWVQPVPQLALAVAAAGFFLAMFRTSTRRSLRAIATILFGQLGLGMAFVLTFAMLFRHLPFRQPALTLVSAILLLGAELVIALICLLCTRVHDRLLGKVLPA